MVPEHRLRSAGLSVGLAREIAAGPIVADGVVDIEGIRFAVEERGRAPYPTELARLDERRARLEAVGTPLLLVPFVSDVVGDSLRRAGWSWADAFGTSAACATCGTSSCSTPRTSWRIVTSTGIRS